MASGWTIEVDVDSADRFYSNRAPALTLPVQLGKQLRVLLLQPGLALGNAAPELAILGGQ